jgi:type I restriction enzyme M protein
MMNFTEVTNFIWGVADLLRGDFKQSEYGKVILPFTVLRRFDCVLTPSKAKILEMNKTLTVSNKMPVFKRVTGHDYYNVSKYDFAKLMDDSNAIETNLRDYINGFSDDVKEILDNFEIGAVIDRLKKANLLYLIVQKFNEIALRDDTVDNLEMGYMFEELIRRFSEQSNETAGEHFTPREVIELMVDLLFDPDMDEMTKDGKVITVYDPACGTGGMLSVAQNKMVATNTKITVVPFGQELNPETYSTCKSDMILKNNTGSKIVLGNSFTEDGFKYRDDGTKYTFDYMLSNPPFGVEWKKVEKFIKDEAESQGYNGRFGAGTPRISDGSLLFSCSTWSQK